SCQPVNAITGMLICQRRVNQTPVAMHPAPSKAAAMPIGSNIVWGESSNIAMPNTPANAAHNVFFLGERRSTAQSS
ncbi:hypothetical protein, partial [Burkholderia sp. SIMBA_024]|uniref:hypothetical protein n=1 Tax=Burkholderia sp. SIMBA_024 TaxID=3085768 RepID=UPI00397D70C5